MRVLHVAESAKGGVGTYLDSLVPPQIEALGAGAVCVLVPAEHRAQLPSAPDGSVRTFPRPDRSLRSLCALGAALAQETARLRPDVIHAHSTFAGLVVRTFFAAAARRPSLVYCPHGWGFDVHAAPWKTQVVAELERVMARACDRVVAISRYEAAQAHAVGIEPRRVRLVVSGLPEAPPVAAAS